MELNGLERTILNGLEDLMQEVLMTLIRSTVIYWQQIYTKKFQINLPPPWGYNQYGNRNQRNPIKVQETP